MKSAFVNDDDSVAVIFFQINIVTFQNIVSQDAANWQSNKTKFYLNC